MILPVIFGSLSVLGLEALAIKPFWYLYGALFFLGLSAVAAFAAQKEFVFKNFFREAAIFFLFFAGAGAVLFYLENIFTRQILIIASSVLFAVRAAGVSAGEKGAMINFLFCVFLSFVSSAALFGLDLFFAVPVIYLTGAAFVSGYLIFLEIAAVAGGGEAALPVFGAVFWSEIFFVMLMLPNAFYLGSAVLAIFTVLFGEIFHIKRAVPRYGARLAAFSMVLLLVLFLTAKWI